MGTIRYICEQTDRLFEYEEKKWYYITSKGERKLIPHAAFYEAGKNEQLNDLKNGKIEIREFLDRGRIYHNPFNIQAYIFVPLKRNGKLTIKKTKKLTKIIEEPQLNN